MILIMNPNNYDFQKQSKHCAPFLQIYYKRVTKIDLTSSTKQILPGTNHIFVFELQNIQRNEGKIEK